MRKNSAGFTILEVILAITVLTLAAGGSFILISQTIGSVSVIQSRLTASYLIQEGLEIARNIRDSNWLKNQTWDQGLPAGDWEADYTTTSFDEDCEEHYNCHIYDDNSFLKIPETDEFYNYSSGTDTIFKRKITISDSQIDKFKVSVKVFWREKGQIRSLAAQEYLYNWYGYKEEMPKVCFDVQENNTQVEGCDGLCQACQTGTCGFADVDTDPAGDDCSATDCYTGNCNGSGACGYYTSGQHGCPSGYECNSSGQCVEVVQDVCFDVQDNEQAEGCNGLCQACQNGTCEVATAGTNPGNLCGTTGCYTGNCKGGTAVCDYYTSGEGNCTTACTTCAGATSGSCVNMSNNTQDAEGSYLCNATCKKCSSGVCGNQTNAENLFSQCTAGGAGTASDGCTSDLCNGVGDCNYQTTGEGNCPVCKFCSGATSFACVNRPDGKDTTSPNTCNTTHYCCSAGTCAYNGSCGVTNFVEIGCGQTGSQGCSGYCGYAGTWCGCSGGTNLSTNYSWQTCTSRCAEWSPPLTCSSAGALCTSWACP